jgi:hypothetical protein
MAVEKDAGVFADNDQVEVENCRTDFCKGNFTDIMSVYHDRLRSKGPCPLAR